MSDGNNISFLEAFPQHNAQTFRFVPAETTG